MTFFSLMKYYFLEETSAYFNIFLISLVSLVLYSFLYQNEPKPYKQKDTKEREQEKIEHRSA